MLLPVLLVSVSNLRAETWPGCPATLLATWMVDNCFLDGVSYCGAPWRILSLPGSRCWTDHHLDPSSSSCEFRVYHSLEPSRFLGRAHAGLISKGVEDALLCMLDCIAKLGMEGASRTAWSGGGISLRIKKGACFCHPKDSMPCIQCTLRNHNL